MEMHKRKLTNTEEDKKSTQEKTNNKIYHNKPNNKEYPLMTLFRWD